MRALDGEYAGSGGLKSSQGYAQGLWRTSEFYLRLGAARQKAVDLTGIANPLLRGISPVLRRYMDVNGECEIILHEGDQTELRHWLATGALDLAVTYDVGEAFSAAITPICKCPSHAILRSDVDRHL